MLLSVLRQQNSKKSVQFNIVLLYLSMENDCRFLVVFYFQNMHDFCLLCLILN